MRLWSNEALGGSANFAAKQSQKEIGTTNTRVVVAAAVIEALDDLDLKYPEVGEDKLKELAAAKKKLLE